MKPQASSWNGRPIAHEDHKTRLDQGAQVHEFENHHPQSEAQQKAYEDYVHDQRVEAASHHLRGLKAAEAAGDDDAAEKHGIFYALHCKAIGHEPVGAPHPDVVARMEKSPEKLYRFKPHRGDMFAVIDREKKDAEEPTKMDKSEDELKRLTLHAIGLVAGAILQKKEKLEKKSPPGRKKEVEELKAKGLPASEAFGIAWDQDKKNGPPKTEKAEPAATPKCPKCGSVDAKSNITLQGGSAKIKNEQRHCKDCGASWKLTKKSEIPETSMERAMKKMEYSGSKHCKCDAYGFPHRHGGGKCQSSK